MKARITIDIDTDYPNDKPDSIEAVEKVVDEALTTGLHWSLLNRGSSQNLSRLWAEAKANGCNIAISLDAGSCWTSKTEVTDRAWLERDFLRADIRRVLTDKELCAEAMVAEIGEIINSKDYE